MDRRPSPQALNPKELRKRTFEHASKAKVGDNSDLGMGGVLNLPSNEKVDILLEKMERMDAKLEELRVLFMTLDRPSAPPQPNYVMDGGRTLMQQRYTPYGLPRL